MEGLFPETYAAFANPILAAFAEVTTVTKESDVAETVYRAAIDRSGQLRFPAGPDAVAARRWCAMMRRLGRPFTRRPRRSSARDPSVSS